MVGLGAMGLPIADRLAAAGCTPLATDASASARSRAAERGLAVVTELDELAGAVEVVVLSLPTPTVVREVVAALWAVNPGIVVFDTSTIDPGTARELGARGPYADAPVLGRPAGVGSWTIPVGCPLDLEAQAVATLGPLAHRVVRVGQVGAAATLKVCNNLMLSAINAVTAEALALADAAGLDPATFVEVVLDSGAASVSGLFRDVAPRAVAGDFAPVFKVALMHKDAQLALDLAASTGLHLGVLEASQRLNAEAVAAGWGGEDSIAVLKILRGVTAPGGDDERSQP